MQVPRTETLEVKAETPRSGLLPQRMAAEVVVVVKVLPLPAQAEEEVVSGQKEIRSASRLYTARAEVVMVAHRQA